MLRMQSYITGTPKGQFVSAERIAKVLRQQADLIEKDGREAIFRLNVKYQPAKWQSRKRVKEQA